MSSNRTILGLLLGLFVFISQVAAGPSSPLFINMTSEDAHRAKMAIGFGKNQLERGHTLTIFLNDRGVLVGSKANNSQYAESQKMIIDLLKLGAVIYICPMCMKHYGVKESDLLPGLQVSNPDRMQEALFKEGTQTLSW